MTTSLNNIYVGLVINNKDPKRKGRVQVYIPHITNTLYSGWNETNTDIRFRTLDSTVFTTEVTQRLIDVLPWAEVAMPFFGGGTGAPIDTTTRQPTPVPTDTVISTPDGVAAQAEYKSEKGNIPKKNLHEDGTVNVDGLNKDVYSKMVDFTTKFPNSVITSANDKTHSPNSTHYDGLAVDIRTRDVVDDNIKSEYVKWFAENGATTILWENGSGGQHLHVDWRPRPNDEQVIKAWETSEPSWFASARREIQSKKNPTIIANGINNKQGIVGEVEDKNQKNDPKLVEERKKFLDQLNDPKVKNEFYSIINAEVGSGSTEAKLMFIETVMNRASARGYKLNGELEFYAQTTKDKISSSTNQNFINTYDSLVNKVINQGTNLTNYATGNANGSVGFAYGSAKDTPEGKVAPGQTAFSGSERFGRENAPQDREWLKKFGQDPDEYKNNPVVATKSGEKIRRPCSDFNGSTFYGMNNIGNAGSAIGFISAPQVGAKAYVMFLDGNHLSPIVLGAFIEPSNTNV